MPIRRRQKNFKKIAIWAAVIVLFALTLLYFAPVVHTTEVVLHP